MCTLQTSVVASSTQANNSECIRGESVMNNRGRSTSLDGILKAWLVIIAMVVGANIAMAGALDDIKKRGYMVVATEDNYPPFEFIQDGKPAGLDHELYELLKQWAPFEVRQQILPWQGLLAG